MSLIAPRASLAAPRSSLLRALLWALRLGATGMLLLALRVGYQRLHRSDEQLELTRYVDTEIPSLHPEELDVLSRLRPLTARSSSGAGAGAGADAGARPLDATAARQLLVDELVPRLLRLRRRAAAIDARTADVRALTSEYLAWIDKLVDACRAAVRAIDDPDTAPAAALARIRARFADADAAARAWSGHVGEACVRHHLVRAPASDTGR